ncbi:hypothetical protein BpHYR1_003568 [Brachionus plicatilis]|uniref:Gap-Pol poly n=1 Tax=Brachionus plicatilis TaxID=10195 RepID=A0A3M7Q2V7_BRAPC|nr:hypothetical protein BpHYR1_003568 [Brachionus plicatilis]
MDKAKLEHDRKIRKFEYKVGDYVLTDHPKLKKGHSHGLAHKYYGPFVIVGINENKVDYFIRLASSPRSKIKQIHKNRLKFYFHSGPSLETIKEEHEDEPVQSHKRKYRKDPNNPRWTKSSTNPRITVNSSDAESCSSTESSSASLTENEEIQTNSKRLSNHSDSSSNGSQIKILKKTKPDASQSKIVRRSSRIVKPPERLTYN